MKRTFETYGELHTALGEKNRDFQRVLDNIARIDQFMEGGRLTNAEEVCLSWWNSKPGKQSDVVNQCAAYCLLAMLYHKAYSVQRK